jgi:hypothetical protein
MVWLWFSTILNQLKPSRAVQVLVALFFFSLAWINCTKSNSKGFVTPSVNLISLVTVAGKPLLSWNIDDSKQVYLTSRKVEVTGICPRDLDLTIALNDTVQTPGVTCAATGKFIWTKVFDQDDTFTLKIATAKDPSLSLSQKFIIDTLAPPPPEITTNGGLPYASPTANFVVTGTVADASSVEADAVGAVSLALPAFSYSTHLSWGTSRVYSFVAVDFAGNRSTPSTITVQFQIPTEMALTGVSTFGLAADLVGDAGNSLSSQSGGAFGAPSGPLTSTGGGLTLSLGLVNVGFLPDP